MTYTWHSVTVGNDSMWSLFNIFTCLCDVLLNILSCNWPR